MKKLFLNFTGIYEAEGISDGGDNLDLSFLSGTGMYIDEETERTIKELVSPFSEYEVRFLDNGNYHYMSRILASLVGCEFDLVTLDHHTDDQAPAFNGLRSCGSWRLDIRDENPRLKDSFLIQNLNDLKDVCIPTERPLYISIDKDVLSEDVVNTNWDQGDMSEEELYFILDRLFDNRKILAVDVCGEDLISMPLKANKDFNERLLSRLGNLFDRS